ncbi:MAG: RES family NAD+ phosphorylase [Halocynthiibacter sp.]
MQITSLNDRAWVRLIPQTYHLAPVLRGVVDTDEEFETLAELEGLTNGRLTAERESSLALDRRELVFARRARDLRVYGDTHINAAFTYTRPTGNRFNDGTRGAWYCAFDNETAAEEVGYHKTRELRYINRFEDETIYVQLLADFIGDFPDLTGEDHLALNPDPELGYPAGQALALTLRKDGHSGLIYPSARRSGGRCFAVFEPRIIQNVRPGASWRLKWDGSPDYTLEMA